MGKRFLNKISFRKEKYIAHCDSPSIIHSSKNASFHSMSKLINVRNHLVRDVLEYKSL